MSLDIGFDGVPVRRISCQNMDLLFPRDFTAPLKHDHGAERSLLLFCLAL